MYNCRWKEYICIKYFWLPYESAKLCENRHTTLIRWYPLSERLANNTLSRSNHIKSSSLASKVDSNKPTIRRGDKNKGTYGSKASSKRGWVEAAYRSWSNTCELISCEQVLSRYNINEMHSISSIACAAPLHLPNRSLSVYLWSSPSVSSPPFSLRFCLSVRAPIAPAFNYEPHRSANNQMKPLAYCWRSPPRSVTMTGRSEIRRLTVSPRSSLSKMAKFLRVKN